MAQQKRAAKSSTATRKKSGSTTRRRTARRTARRAGSRRNQSLLNGGLLAVRNGVSSDVHAMQAEIQHLVGDLQDRLSRLNGISRQGATHASEGVQHFITDTLGSFTSKAMSNLTSRVQDGANDLTDEATRMGGKALKRVSKEIDRRPLLTLAIAAGVGYLAGMAMRRE